MQAVTTPYIILSLPEGRHIETHVTSSYSAITECFRKLGLVLQILCCDKIMQLVDDIGSHSRFPTVAETAHGAQWG